MKGVGAEFVPFQSAVLNVVVFPWLKRSELKLLTEFHCYKPLLAANLRLASFSCCLLLSLSLTHTLEGQSSMVDYSATEACAAHAVREPPPTSGSRAANPSDSLGSRTAYTSTPRLSLSEL
jgi:hypothetical protein